MSTVNSNDVWLVKKGRFFSRERNSLLNMESKGIQNRKANRDRAALIYMSAIISTLWNYLFVNSMACLKLVTTATVTWHVSEIQTFFLQKTNASSVSQRTSTILDIVDGVKERRSPWLTVIFLLIFTFLQECEQSFQYFYSYLSLHYLFKS